MELLSDALSSNCTTGLSFAAAPTPVDSCFSKFLIVAHCGSIPELRLSTIERPGPFGPAILEGFIRKNRKHATDYVGNMAGSRMLPGQKPSADPCPSLKTARPSS